MSSDGNNYSLLHQFSDSRVNSLLSASDNNLYIGTSDSGKIYKYNGSEMSLLFNINEDFVYDMTEIDGNIYIATGNNGRIYKHNISSNNLEIIYNDVYEKILSIGIGRDYNSNSNTVYSGTQPGGKILRRILTKDLFVKSFESVYGECKRIKSIYNFEEDSSDLYACVDNILLKLINSSWSIVYVNQNEDKICDIEFFNGELFIITSEYIKTLQSNEDKYVYVKFIDFAGNETLLYTSDGKLKPRTELERLFDILTIEQQIGFSLNNRIIIVDKFGNIKKTIVGNRSYLSADRIDEEIGVYESEVFNGTNNLISWESISYSSIEPDNTYVEINIRAANTEREIYSKEWSEKIYSGIDISGISGKYIQFRATLKSKLRGISPVLNNVTIKSKSTFAVHYFTTNFPLNANLKSGIMTANTVTPVGTELVFGITTSTNTNWENYKIIEPNKLFVLEEEKRSPNLKIGIKFLSSSAEVPELHEFGMIFCTEDGKLIKLNI
jgi:hypothetical protein